MDDNSPVHPDYPTLTRGAIAATPYDAGRRGRITGAVKVYGPLVMVQVDYGMNANYEDAENLIAFTN